MRFCNKFGKTKIYRYLLENGTIFKEKRRDGAATVNKHVTWNTLITRSVHKSRALIPFSSLRSSTRASGKKDERAKLRVVLLKEADAAQ